MSEQFNLDREVAIKNRVDGTGKKWNIHVNKSSGLCFVRPEPDRVDAVIPKPMQGLWTKATILEPVLNRYLIETWDQADSANLKAERKREVAREHKVKKVEDVSGTANQ